MTGRKGSQIEGKRFLCSVLGCTKFLKNKDEIKSSHLPVCAVAKAGTWTTSLWKAKTINALSKDQELAWLRGEHQLKFPQIDCSMDTTTSVAGRGQREKKMSEKLKETIGKKLDNTFEDPDRKYPPVYNADHVKISAEVKALETNYAHTKITATGERYEMHSLGSQ